MTYEQYVCIMKALETRQVAAKSRLRSDGLNGRFIAQLNETEQAIKAAREALASTPNTVVIRSYSYDLGENA